MTRSVRVGASKCGYATPVVFSLYLSDVFMRFATSNWLHTRMMRSSQAETVRQTPAHLSQNSPIEVTGLDDHHQRLEQYLRCSSSRSREASKSLAITDLRKASTVDRFYLLSGGDLWHKAAGSIYVSEVRRRTNHGLSVIGFLLNGRSGVLIRKGILLCKELTLSVVDCVCSVHWRVEFAGDSFQQPSHYD
jgi:hypothetical protein